MKTSLYAIAQFDRSAFVPADVSALGLERDLDGFGTPHIRALARDAENLRVADGARDGDDWCCFLGEIEDADAVSALLGCGAAPAEIALAAVRRWGHETSRLLKGEWALLHWDAEAATVSLAMSRVVRDRVYFAFDGQRLAVGGDLAALSRISWIGGSFDREGVAYALSTGALRRRGIGRTVMRNVHELVAGSFHRFSADGAYDYHSTIPEFSRWTGGFDDAVTALDRRLREVVRAMLAPHDRVAIFMSGGLDSALVARFVAEERRPGQRVVGLTAAAPPGSVRADERVLAADIAGAFGIEHRLVWPDPAARLFMPGVEHHAAGELSLSPRHFLYDALFDAARAFGATAVFDGADGEASLSRHEETGAPPGPLRTVVRWGRGRYRRWRHGLADASSVYHARLAPALLATLPPEFADIPGPVASPSERRAADAPMGWPSDPRKMWRTPSSVVGAGLRRLRPLRDPQLVAMVAGMPGAYTSQGGRDRALARAMLKGHVPERVHLQPKGPAFSVDYVDRFRADLPQVLDRLPVWRAAGVDAWLDLDWMDGEVRRMMKTGPGSVDLQFRLQMSAIAAEYFLEMGAPRW